MGALQGACWGQIPACPPRLAPRAPQEQSPDSRDPQRQPPEPPRGSPQTPEPPRSSSQSPPGAASSSQSPLGAAPKPQSPPGASPKAPQGQHPEPSTQSRIRPCPGHAHPRPDHAPTPPDHAHPLEATPPSRSPLAPRGGSRAAPRLYANEPGARRALIGYDARRRLRPLRGPGGGGGGGRRGAGAARRARLGSARPRSAPQ